MSRFSLREHIPSVLVATLSATFGVSLLLVTGDLASILETNAAAASSHTVSFVLEFIAWVFVAIALYTGTVTTSNTFSTIIAGRVRTIALLRLVGASARSQRRAVAGEGLIVGVIGGVLGFVLGIGVNAVLIAVARGLWTQARVAHFSYLSASAALPVAAVILTTWLASWIGSRRVLVVSPMQATGAAEERSVEEAAHRPGRNAVAITLFALGVIILLLAVLAGRLTPAALLVGVVGGILSFTGVVLGATLFIPPALRLTGRILGRSASARLAAQNAVRYPERSARTTIGLVIGVTLITMFTVATATAGELISVAQKAQPDVYQGTQQIFAVLTAIFSVIGGFSAVLAAIGMVNNLSLSVLQRTRELGLLRALGFTGRQVREMIVAESAQLTIAALVSGLVLGTFYGWCGAEAMLGGIPGLTGLVPPALPWPLLVGVIAAAAILTWAAAAAPARRATRVAPVTALAVD